MKDLGNANTKLLCLHIPDYNTMFFLEQKTHSGVILWLQDESIFQLSQILLNGVASETAPLNETARPGIARAAGAKERAINNQESDTIVRDPSRVRQGGRLSQSSREGISSFYGWPYKHHRASPNPEQILVKT